MGQLGDIMPVAGDDLRPGNLVTGQGPMGKGGWHVPSKDGRHVAALDLEGCRQVGRLHHDFLMGCCGRKPGQRFNKMVIGMRGEFF